jgi:hypothetical protein
MPCNDTPRETLERQLSALRDARARGVRRVRDQSSTGAMTEVEYRTDGELLAAINELERRLATGTRPPIRTVRFQTSKGF